MIARMWYGIVPANKADDYLKLMLKVALPEYRSTPGNRGAWCLRFNDGEITHFEMLTFWNDLASIKKFAGEEFESAKYYDFDSDYLLSMEPKVRHYEVHDASLNVGR